MLETILLDVTAQVPWDAVTETVSEIDLNLHNLMFYALTMTILIENSYQLIKPFFKKKIKKKELDTNTGIVEKEVDHKNVIIPLIIGLVLALTFFPVTYFDFMPFKPSWIGLEIIFTGLIFARAANAGHGAFDRIQELGLSLIGRIIGIKKY